MGITTSTLVLFVAVAPPGYYWLPPRWQKGWLLLASYVFCLSWAWAFGLVLLLLTVANYVLAGRLARSQPRRRALLWLGIGLNVLTLVYFRAADFFMPQLLASEQSGMTEAAQILIPVGLSYYVLE